MLSSIPVLAVAGAAAPKPIDLTMSWSLSLDASGAITALAPTVQTNQELYQRLEPSIRKWQFTTGKVNGKPAPAQTTLTVHITLEPADGLYRVRVRDAATGPRYATMTPPKYPDGALVSRRGGAVMLEVDYDAAGNVTSAKPIDGGLHAYACIPSDADLAVQHQRDAGKRHLGLVGNVLHGRAPRHPHLPAKCFPTLGHLVWVVNN